MHADIAQPRHWSLLLVLLGFKWEMAKMVASGYLVGVLCFS